MASNLEEPGRSRALHIINQALQYRNLSPPKPNIPLTIPFPGPRSVSQNTVNMQWLKTTIQPPQTLGHPAPPAYSPFAGSSPQDSPGPISTTTAPGRVRCRTLRPHNDLPCACDHLKTILLDPTTPTVDNHYILTLEQLALPPHLRIFLAANMNSTFLPQQGQIFPFIPDCFHQMAAHSRPSTLTHTALGTLPPAPMEAPHRPFETHQPRFTARLLRQPQKFLGDQVVLHHADHELQQLRIFCPRQYFAGALATWQSPELFSPMPTLQSSNIHEHLIHTIPPSLRTRYKWGFRKDFTIPYGIVHLKEKKQWSKGRTIISYFQSLSGNLLRITSRALDIILQHLLPQHPGQLSIPQLWSHFHCYLTDTPPDIPLHATNDDLVGFSNSVPQHRLIDAVHSLTQQWQRQNHTHTLTVDTKATGNPFHHSHIGRHHRSATLHNAPSILRTLQPLWHTHSTPAFSGHATTPTSKSGGLGLAPSSPLPFATLPSPSSNTPGINFTTISFNTLPSTSHTIATWTTVSLSTMNTSFHTPPSRPSSTTTFSAIPSNWKQWRTFTFWASTLTSSNAPSHTYNPPNPGKSGTTPAPVASAWLCPA